MRRIEAIVSSAVLALLYPRVALGCPDCATARLVRTQVLDDGRFLAHLAATAAPLVVLVAIAALLRDVGRTPPRGP
jgi:hypothetical protein